MVTPLVANVKGADPRNYGVAKKASLFTRPFGSILDSDWDEVGNLASLDAIPDITQLEHKSNRRSGLIRDRIEITERKMNFDLKLDEVKTSNFLKAFGSSVGKSADVATIRDSIVKKNPGSGLAVALPLSKPDSVIVRSTNEEGASVTYDQAALAAFSVDSSDPTAGGSFAVTTNPLTVVGAVVTYSGVSFAVGLLIKIENEILRVSAVAGNDVTFARGQNGTVIASHANGHNLFTTADQEDYILDGPNSQILIDSTGDLANNSTVPEIWIYEQKSVATESFQMFDGTPVRLEAEYQVLTTKGARIVITLPNCIVTNKGTITFGLGDKWIEMPMVLDVLADETGSLGYFHVIDAAAVI